MLKGLCIQPSELRLSCQATDVYTCGRTGGWPGGEDAQHRCLLQSQRPCGPVSQWIGMPQNDSSVGPSAGWIGSMRFVRLRDKVGVLGGDEGPVVRIPWPLDRQACPSLPGP